MKLRKAQKRLQARINNWETNPVIKAANQKSPGTYKKPGSLNK